MDPVSLIFGIGLLIASYAITAAITPKGDKPKPAALGDFDFPQVAEGTPQCVIFGDIWVEDWMVLWYGNMRNTPVKSDGTKK